MLDEPAVNGTPRRMTAAMSVATLLPAPSRASTSSSSSFIPVSRQNTLSSNDGRSVRQSKRFSVTALYMSMSGTDKDSEIDDELAKGMEALSRPRREVHGAEPATKPRLTPSSSPEHPTRDEDEDLIAIEEELRA